MRLHPSKRMRSPDIPGRLIELGGKARWSVTRMSGSSRGSPLGGVKEHEARATFGSVRPWSAGAAGNLAAAVAIVGADPAGNCPHLPLRRACVVRPWAPGGPRMASRAAGVASARAGTAVLHRGDDRVRGGVWELLGEPGAERRVRRGWGLCRRMLPDRTA